MAIEVITHVLLWAVTLISEFKGGPAQAKITPTVQDAIAAIRSLLPLLEDYGCGVNVTPADIRYALAGNATALARLEMAIGAAA